MASVENPFDKVRRKMVAARVEFMAQLAKFTSDELTRPPADSNEWTPLQLAYVRHIERQADRYFVVTGDVRVVMYDDRHESSTRGRFNQEFFTDESRGLVRIPPGIWHADQNWGGRDAMVVNFPTRPYDRANPDKRRIDPHSGEIPFDWDLPDA